NKNNRWIVGIFELPFKLNQETGGMNQDYGKRMSPQAVGYFSKKKSVEIHPSTGSGGQRVCQSG
ncbi:hypothetical protein RM545_17555, partial [Zunongwangia sp. F260]